jgi:phage-related protein (TIGR01555 family)
VDSLESIDFLNVLDVSEIRAERWYASPFRDKYGDPAMYRVTPRLGGAVLPMGYELVHASRILRFNGVELTREEEQQQYGWGDSIVVSLFDTLSAWAQGHSGAAHLLTDANQAVFKWKGLAALFKSKHYAEIQERARMIDSMRSLLRAIIVDPEEGFERVATQFAGIPDTLDRLTLQLAAALGYPVTVLMGRAPSGINTNGDADLQSFRAVAMSGQTSDLQPHVERMARLLFACRDGTTQGQEPEGWTVQWAPLEILSQKERAELEKTVAEKDVAYIGAGVARPEEIAVSRYGGDDPWSMDTTLDLELRKDMPPPTPVPPTPEDPAPEPAPAPTPTPGPAKPPPTPGAPPPAGEPLASTALNGAQVTSAAGIVTQVAKRELPRESGVAMLALFFNRTAEEADRIMGSVGLTFFATPPPAAVPPSPTPEDQQPPPTPAE